MRNSAMPRETAALAVLAVALPSQGVADASVPRGSFSPDHCAAVVEAARKPQQIPGMSVAIGYRGKLIWTRGFGKADLENDVAASKDTVYRLASISKPITAVAVMQLVEAGKVDLDKPVQEYVPTFPKKKW